MWFVKLNKQRAERRDNNYEYNFPNPHPTLTPNPKLQMLITPEPKVLQQKSMLCLICLI